MCTSRPRPRRPTGLQVGPVDDVIPRVPVHPPPTSPAVLSAATLYRMRGKDLLPFPGSPDQETELKDDSGKAAVQSRPAKLPPSQQQSDLPRTLVARSQSHDEDVCRSTREMTQFVPTASSQGRFVESQTDIPEHYQDTAHSTGTVTKPGQSTRSVDLITPKFKTEIIQMRDELKRFHDMKLHHKQLETQLAAAKSQSGEERMAEVATPMIISL